MKKKVLIIDDDPVMSFVCQRLLTKNGYDTDLAPDGGSGLERVATFQPDGILLDLMMPKVNGMDFLQRLRAQEAYRTLPVIVLTNAAVPFMIEQASNAGATHILDKSKFNPVTIIDLLHSLLQPESPRSVNSVSQSGTWKV